MGFGSDNKKLKEQQHRQLRKIRAASVKFNVFITSCSICQMLTIFFGVEFQKTVSKFKKRKRKSCLVFMSSTKCEIRNFCVVVLQ